MTVAQAWDIHSMPDLLRDFDANTTPIQLVPHRGIPDGSMEALRRAIIGKKGEGGNAVELDPLWIAGNPYVMHDLTGDRQTLFQGAWSLWPPGQRMPQYIQRDVEGAKFTEKYVPTNFPVAPLLHCLWELLALNSAGTIFLDGRNEDAAKLVALISNHPAYRNNALVQCYPYTFRNGVEFVDMVGELNPAAGWKRTVAVAPVLNPDTLPTLAGVGRYSLDYAALYTAGQTWFTSMINTEMRIFALGFPVSGIGRGVNPTTGETHDLNGDVVTEPRVKAMFLWDRVLLDLVAWAKEMHPLLAIIMHSITYSYSYGGQRYTNAFHTGHPVAWPEGAESHGRELMAVPGNALRLGANIVICDRVNDNLNAALGMKNYTWPTDVDYPTLSIDMGEAEQGPDI